MYLPLLINIILFVGEVWSNNLISPCKKIDLPCIEKSINAALPKIFDGIPELGVIRSDPNFVKVIEGDVSILKYKFANNTFVGYKNCNITDLKFNEDFTTLSCHVNCPPLLLAGQYEIKGQLLNLPIDGKGDFEFTSGYYLVKLDAELETIKGSDGKNHLFIKDIEVKPKPLTEIVYKLRPYDTNGEKDLTEVHNFTKQNWLEIALLLQHPVWSSSINEVARHVNKYLENVAVEDILLE